MKSFLNRAIACVPAFLFAASAITTTPTPIHAQDETIVCDSDLIMNLYVAQNYFGLGTVIERLVESGAGQDIELVDIAAFELGQYEPLFEDIDPETAILDDDTIDAIVAELGVPSTDRMTAVLDATNPLQPAVITGEPAECSILRFQLNFFYTLVAELS